MNFSWNSVKRETMAGIFSSWGKMVHLKCHVPGTLQENNNLPIQSVYNYKKDGKCYLVGTNDQCWLISK